MKKFFSFVILFAVTNVLNAQLPKVSIGKIVRLENFNSKFVDSRNVDVWLPENYSEKEKFSVIYMHDGQMLFDSTTTWNKQEWQVDETLKTLTSNKKLSKCIVVGIWNNGDKRFAEYFPENCLQFIQNNTDTTGFKQRLKGFEPLANDYLKFLTQELKPAIDSMFSTKKDAANTYISGSSMGGLISLYAICEYPNIFGKAACLSTHFPILFTNVNNNFPVLINKYLVKHLPDAKTHKVYFDYGTKTLDSLYKSYQKNVDIIMQKKRYTNKNWITKEFDGADHSEKSWAARLSIPFIFLLKK